eukprot:106929_1
MSEGIHGFMFAIFDLILITVNVFVFVLPSYATFLSYYDNKQYLCYDINRQINESSHGDVYKWILFGIILSICIIPPTIWLISRFIKCVNSTQEKNSDTRWQMVSMQQYNLALNDKKDTTPAPNILLLMGIAGGGKTTIYKQIQQLYGPGIIHLDYKQSVHDQAIFRMKDCVNVMNSEPDTYQLSSLSESGTAATEFFQNDYYVGNIYDIEMNNKFANNIKCLWNEPAIKQMYDKRAKLPFYLAESTKYFWDHIDRIKGQEYIPTTEDILRLQYATCGNREMIFECNNHQYTVTDLPGGSCDRRSKWIHSFRVAATIIFVVDLCGYDRPELYSMSRFDPSDMETTIQCWMEICNGRWFRRNLIILLLNKKDLFKKKIATTPITICTSFRDYAGDTTDYDEVIDYIRKKFIDSVEDKSKTFFIYETCAIDSDHMNMLFQNVDRNVMDFKETFGML